MQRDLGRFAPDRRSVVVALVLSLSTRLGWANDCSFLLEEVKLLSLSLCSLMISVACVGKDKHLH